MFNLDFTEAVYPLNNKRNYSHIIRIALSVLCIITLLILTIQPESFAQSRENKSISSVKHKQKGLLSKGNTKIWLDHGISLKGQTHTKLLSAVDNNKKTLSPELLESITSIIRDKLEEDGLAVSGAEDQSQKENFQIRPIITKYEAGSIGERWIAPGAGATICIIRATILDAKTDKVIGEVISWRQVASGGLFSAGAKKYVPKEAAEAVAEAIYGQTQ